MHTCQPVTAKTAVCCAPPQLPWLFDCFVRVQELKQTMAGLLRLHMSLQNEAQGDEQVGGASFQF